MRKSLALIVGGGLLAAVALTGCSTSAQPQATSGKTVDAVSVSGEFGQTPEVEFPTPLVATNTQCREVIEGEGDFITPGQYLELGLYWANGTTGEEVASAGFEDGNTQTLSTGSGIPAPLTEGLSCAREGSRVVITTPADRYYGPDRGNDQLGIAPEDTLVFVIDVKKAYPERADGAVKLSKDGFPAVVLDELGRPGITVPARPAPDEFRLETLKQGSGPVVEDGDRVVINYTGVIWDSSEVFQSSWEGEYPVPVVVQVGEDSGNITGLSDAIVGQTVGSQVVAILPPDAAYGEAGSGTIPANATLVFVIDILGVVSGD